MSLRYPTIARSPWLPQTISVAVPGTGTRDRYGKLTGQQTQDLPAKVVLQSVELLEAGGRARRRGCQVIVPDTDMVISEGTEFSFDGIWYTVISVNARPNVMGFFESKNLLAVVKAGQ